MADSYQAICDAVRSRIGHVDIDGAVRGAAERAFDISHVVGPTAQAIQIAADDIRAAQTRPSVLYRPALSMDGDQWCAFYGANIQDGVAGFGSSPAEAMAAFDAAWTAEVTP